MSCLPCLLSPWTGIIRRSHRIPSVYAASIYRDVTKIALTPPPRHITLPSSPRLDATSPRYLSSHLPPPSRSSSRSSSPPENFLAASLLPSRVSVYTPVQSPTTLRNTKISLSSFLYLPFFIYPSVSASKIYKNFSLQIHQLMTRKSKKKRKKKNHTWLELSPLRFFYDDSTNQSPHQEPPTTSPPSPRLTHSNKFLPLFHTLFPFLLLPLLFPFTSHTSLFSAPS